MHVRMSHQSQSGLYQRTNQINALFKLKKLISDFNIKNAGIAC